MLQRNWTRPRIACRKNNEKNKQTDPLPTLDDIKTPYGSSYRNMLAEVKHV